MIVRTLLLVFGLSLLLFGLFHSLAQNRYNVGGFLVFKGPELSSDLDFLPHEMELIRSDKILSKVREELHLAKDWGAKPKTGRLNIEALEQLILKRIISTNGLEVRVVAAKADEAANIANAIALATQKYHQDETKAGRGSITVARVNHVLPSPRPFFPNHYLGGVSLLAGGVLIAGWWCVGRLRFSENPSPSN